MIEIRTLTAMDAVAYRDLRMQALRTNPEAFATTYEEYLSRSIEQVASQLEPNSDHFTLGAFIEDRSDKLVGTATLVRERSSKMRHIANVVAMYVTPDARRQGVGRYLLTEIIRRGRQLDGMDQLRLSVIRDNDAAISLYRSAGFQTVGIEPNALKTPEGSWDEVHMVLSLSGEEQALFGATRDFSHVNINVSQLDQSLRFSTGTLDMKLVHQGRRDAYLEYMDIDIFAPTGEDDHRWLTQLWQSEWGGDTMVSRGDVFHLTDLESLIAKVGGECVGAATYRFDGDGGCELMSINATGRGAGVGTKLLAAVEGKARHAGCRWIWLITSNDNLDALRFYQRRGYRITSVHTGAIDEARHIKPSIPLIGDHGIEVHDEIELAKSLRGAC